MYRIVNVYILIYIDNEYIYIYTYIFRIDNVYIYVYTYYFCI